MICERESSILILSNYYNIGSSKGYSSFYTPLIPCSRFQVPWDPTPLYQFTSVPHPTIRPFSHLYILYGTWYSTVQKIHLLECGYDFRVHCAVRTVQYCVKRVPPIYGFWISIVLQMTETKKMTKKIQNSKIRNSEFSGWTWTGNESWNTTDRQQQTRHRDTPHHSTQPAGQDRTAKQITAHTTIQHSAVKHRRQHTWQGGIFVKDTRINSRFRYCTAWFWRARVRLSDCPTDYVRLSDCPIRPIIYI